jgi:nitroimidazol reductase NimA-like FMN-containing flavoprotein (pyridoxamine 5'-phosphate oxidase superfamily)
MDYTSYIGRQGSCVRHFKLPIKKEFPVIEMTEQEVQLLLANAAIGRLAMTGKDGKPYVIPMPFCWLARKIYLRLPMKGRKATILKENNQVCFEADCFTDDLSHYASVIVEGRLEPVEDSIEKGSVNAANHAKYNRLRKGNRPGHGRAMKIEDLPLQKIYVTQMSGRKKSSEPMNSMNS